MKKLVILFFLILIFSIASSLAAGREGIIVVEIVERGIKIFGEGTVSGNGGEEGTVSGNGDGGGSILSDSVTQLNSFFSLVLIMNGNIEEGKNITLDIGFNSSKKINNVVFKVESTDFEFADFKLNYTKGIKTRFNMSVEPKKETKAGVYSLTFNLFIDNQKIFSEPFDIEVKKTPSLVFKIVRRMQEISGKTDETPEKFYSKMIFILALILLGTVIFLAIRLIKERKNNY